VLASCGEFKLWGVQASRGEVPLGAASAASQMRLGRLAKHGRLGPARRCVARTLLNAVYADPFIGLIN
jgi:hypothetical protein